MKTVLITGAAKRIGKEIATFFAEQGWAVAIHCRHSLSEAETLLQDLETAGAPKAQIFQADLKDRTAVQDLIPKVVEVMGPLSLLVNNASLFEDDDIHSLSDDSWDSHMAVNLHAPLVLSQAFMKHLPQGNKGNIINIIDQRVWKLNPQFLSYTTSKAALWTLTQTLAQAMAPMIRVNAIGPGPVLASIHQDATSFQDEAQSVLLGHGPSPLEIARAIDFIVQSPSMTGQMIALDGGQHLAWQTPDIPV